MKPRHILVIGGGHLAIRIRKLAERRGETVTHRAREVLCAATASAETSFEGLARALRELHLPQFSGVFLVDDRDDYNIELLIALISLDRSVPIVASLFNENIAPHLQAAHPRVRVLNPARLAAPAFIDALTTPVTHTLRYAPTTPNAEPLRAQPDRLMRTLMGAFLGLIVSAVSYFHFVEKLSWLNAVYFVVVTASTVGYGDISLRDSSALSRLVGIALILCSTAFIWMIFSLTIDSIIKRRVQLSLGRKHYSQRGHVILCGLGRLGYFIAEGLISNGEKLLIIEKDEGSRNIEHFRSLGADVYIADARLPNVLVDAGITKAKALYSVTDNDFGNLEIGLNARSFVPRMRLILRIFDASMSRRISETLDIHLGFSMSAIVEEAFLAAMLDAEAGSATS